MTATFEAEHVHAVYDEIAADFSRTRHSRWPFVQLFLEALEPAGSLVLDAGTGNGKYLGCRSVLEWQGRREQQPASAGRKGKGKAVDQDEAQDRLDRADLMPIGFDMSTGLLTIANQRGHEVVRGDCVDLSCWRRGAFDHAISIATIHHFATPERRCEAVKQMILAVLPPDPPPSFAAPSTSSAKSVRPPSRLLIVVWSLEQDPNLVTDDRSARRKTNGKKGAVPIAVPLGGGDQASEDAAAKVEVKIAALSMEAGLDTKTEGEENRDKEEEKEPAQDVFVPWTRQNQISKAEKAAAAAAAKLANTTKTSNGPRARNDDSDPRTSNGESAIGTGSAPPASLSAASSATAAPAPTTSSNTETAPTFNRYYHLFRHYELSNLVRSAAHQLGLKFSAPTDYPLFEAELIASFDERGRKAVNEREGWEARVRLCEERWERENWVVEVEVGWQRRTE